MNPLDDELRRALAPKEPRGDFTRRVVERARAESAPGGARRWLGWRWVPQFRWAAVAVVCLLVVAGGLGYRRYQRYQRTRAEGEQAREQVMLALQIASSKLNGALSKVEQVEGRGPAGRAGKKPVETRRPTRPVR